MNTITSRLLLCLLISVCISLKPQTMTVQVLQRLKVQQDYIHHFIFYSIQTFNSLNQQNLLEIYSGQKNIKFYINDCKNNPMQECQTKDTIPLMLLYNRIFIRFNGGLINNKHQEIIQWMNSRIDSYPALIQSQQQLNQQLSGNVQVFCYCFKQPAQKALFFSLSKAVIIANFCIIDNAQLIANLTLKPGNITLFKNISLTDRIQFQYANRYDMWETFVRNNVFTHVNRVNQVLRKRFSQQNKTQDVMAVFCDFSFHCEQFWRQFATWSRKIQTQKNINIQLTFYHPKQSSMINVYLHSKLNQSQFPALMNVKILSENGKAGWLRRYIAYLDILNQQTLLQFKKDIEEGRIRQQFSSGEIPKKDGFYGKNSQKLIQKLVASSINKTISSSSKHYVLLLTTLGTGCKQCEDFYTQYKKAASYLVDQDITLGYMDVISNDVQIDNVESIPEVLLYNKYIKDDPVRMTGRANFDSLLRFLENNAIINYSGEL